MRRLVESSGLLVSTLEVLERSVEYIYRVYPKNGAVSKVNKKFISHLTRAQRTPSAAATVQVSHALRVVPLKF